MKSAEIARQTDDSPPEQEVFHTKQEMPRRKGIGLQMRMTISYVGVAILNALMLACLGGIIFYLVIVHSPYAKSLARGGPLDVLKSLPLIALVVLILMAPAGGMFGALFTRGIVRRIHRLVQATTRFATGDYTQRVTVKKHDEIGQLEAQFNQMAEQLVESIEQRQALAEQHARMEERARIEQELHSARYIQQTLLPKEVPALAGWQIETYYDPAREVGGDFYDFFSLPDGRLGIVMGDATDKGMAAALLMATTCTTLRATAQGITSPAEVLTRVNDLLYLTIPSGMFATCFYAILEPESGRLSYANAGHDWPYRRSADGVVELQATGMPLGMLPGVSYEEQETLLYPGESLFFYSDGLVEAHNEKRDMFDLPHLKESLGKHAGGPALIDFMRDELAAFTGEHCEQEDDITLMVLYRSPLPVVKEIEAGEQDAWSMLAEWSVASAPGNERQVMEQVARIVEPHLLPPGRLEGLKTAVAEATMNAMEHGNQYHPDKPVTLQILSSRTALSVRILDHGGALPVAEPALPDIEAKLAGLQVPRGWGLFLMHELVDEMRVMNEGQEHTVDLIMRRVETEEGPAM